MKLVAGLGNPGRRYAESRHNIGFHVVAELARRWGLGAARYERRFEGLLAEGQRGDQRVLLLQPQTYMNVSGRSVAAVWRFYKLALTDLMVVVDDLDLPVGRVRLRAGGSAGGHRGMADIIRHLGSEEFPRLRIGIGKVPAAATVEYVLGRFRPEERDVIAQAVATAADAVECWLDRGLEIAMTRFNRRNGPSQGDTRPADGSAKGDDS